jgi:hypothetical protein
MTISFGFACFLEAIVFCLMELIDLKSRVAPWSLISFVAFGFCVIVTLFGFLFPILCSEKHWQEFDSEHKRDAGIRAMIVSLFILLLRYRQQTDFLYT